MLFLSSALACQRCYICCIPGRLLLTQAGIPMGHKVMVIASLQVSSWSWHVSADTHFMIMTSLTEAHTPEHLQHRTGQGVHCSVYHRPPASTLCSCASRISLQPAPLRCSQSTSEPQSAFSSHPDIFVACSLKYAMITCSYIASLPDDIETSSVRDFHFTKTRMWQTLSDSYLVGKVLLM